jgi:hypothetical protein
MNTGSLPVEKENVVRLAVLELIRNAFQSRFFLWLLLTYLWPDRYSLRLKMPHLLDIMSKSSPGNETIISW